MLRSVGGELPGELCVGEEDADLFGRLAAYLRFRKDVAALLAY
jgi:hypothetical protein